MSSHKKSCKDNLNFIKVLFDGPEMFEKGKRTLFTVILKTFKNYTIKFDQTFVDSMSLHEKGCEDNIPFIKVLFDGPEMF